MSSYLLQEISPLFSWNVVWLIIFFGRTCWGWDHKSSPCSMGKEGEVETSRKRETSSCRETGCCGEAISTKVIYCREIVWRQIRFSRLAKRWCCSQNTWAGYQLIRPSMLFELFFLEVFVTVSSCFSACLDARIWIPLALNFFLVLEGMIPFFKISDVCACSDWLED